MNKLYEEIKSKAYSAFRALSKECVQFDDARTLLAAADSSTSLVRSKISKAIDTDWIEKIEQALPALDIIIRNPSVTIEDIDEVLPVELSRNINEKSIKHLAQHTNLILDIKDDEVIPQKILNVFHEETACTYENKFVNTLLSRLTAFVDKRLRALAGSCGTEMNYKFGYTTDFEHFVSAEDGRNTARIDLRIELTSPLSSEKSESDIEINERYIEALNRIKRINMTLIGYSSSAFAKALGKNYVRPPVIRTNAILKNKNLRECLNLWEFIESYDKVGYSFIGDKYYELPSSDFVGGMYSSAALQYLTLYSGITGDLEDNRLLSEKHLFETLPDFDDEVMNEELDDYLVYDSEYRKTVPVSRLMNNRKKLSEDEKRIRRAILVALKADEIINEQTLREEAEKRRLAREKRLAEEEARRLAEEEARRLAEEEARRLAEEEARRLAEEEARRLAEAEAAKREVPVRYRRSFMSRFIQAEPCVQDYYNEIKNLLLSYKGVKARTSWSKESFNRGRIHIAKIDIKGKALYLYLALDPATLDGTKYRTVSVKGDCPTLIKVKSERKKKYAIELIEMLMESLAIARIEREFEDYRLPYEQTDALIERGLIKVVLPKGESLGDDTVAVKDDLSGIIKSKPADASDAPVEQETELCAEQTTEQITEEDSLDEVTEESVSEITFEALQTELSMEISEASQVIDEAPTEALCLENSEEEATRVTLNAETDEQSVDETEQMIAFADESEKLVEARLDKIVKSLFDGREYEILNVWGTPIVSRAARGAKKIGFSFKCNDADKDTLVVPYTRAQYLALARKQKKRVLMNVKALLRYRATAQLLESLKALDTNNARIAERIELLELRLKEERKFLPTSQLWADAVKRVTK